MIQEEKLTKHESTLIMTLVICLLAGFFGVSILQKIEKVHAEIIGTMYHEQEQFFQQNLRQARDIQKLKYAIKDLKRRSE